MTKHQSMLVDMFKWFHEICHTEGLNYFAIGGTALGAVRHQGFIPWDDDIDVGMPRSDYEKLLVLKDKLNVNSRYNIEFPSTKKDYVYPYCKIYDTYTTLIENTRYKTKRGIYIDVFPIDGVGQTLEESVKNFKTIDNKVNLLSSTVCALRKGRKLYKNLAILGMRCIPDIIVDSRKLIKTIDSISKNRKFEDYNFVANFVGNWHEKEIMKKDWIGNRKLCKFEDAEMYIPENYDEYLTRMYGDYMQLPPIEKRCTHHDYIFMDLTKSYLE